MEAGSNSITKIKNFQDARAKINVEIIFELKETKLYFL
jgi:hypothetical protein